MRYLSLLLFFVVSIFGVISCVSPNESLILKKSSMNEELTEACLGEVTLNATFCPGANNNLLVETNITLVTMCGVFKCETYCNVGFHIENNRCVQDYRDGNRDDNGVIPRLNLGSLSIQKDRIPDFTFAGVEGGIPNTSGWRVIDATDFGAIPNDNQDDSVAINSAITNASSNNENTVVFLPHGTYNLTQPNVIMLKSNVVLRGAGPGNTIIFSRMGTTSSSGIIIQGSSTAETIAITGGLNRGSDTLVLESTPDYQVDDFIIVSQNNNDIRVESGSVWHARGIGQIVKVIEVNGNSVKISPALRVYLSSGASPSVRRPNFIKNVGVEDLSINFADVVNVPLYKGDTISVSYALNSWIKNVKAENTYQNFFNLSYSARITMRDNYIKKVQKTTYTNSYAINFGSLVSDSLAENNIQDDVWVTAMFSHSCNGNVYAYNYHKNIRQDHGIIHHGTFPFENLVEGNEAYRITNDIWWGQQGPRSTFFRNRVSEIRTSKNKDGTVSGTLVADEANFIANSANYFLSFPWCSYPEGCGAFDDLNTNLWAEMNLYRIEFKGLTSPNLTSTFINNFSGDKIPTNLAELKLPPSLYLTMPPSFWCKELPWPAIGADIDDFGSELNLLPAERRDKGLPCTI